LICHLLTAVAKSTNSPDKNAYSEKVNSMDRKEVSVLRPLPRLSRP